MFRQWGAILTTTLLILAVLAEACAGQPASQSNSKNEQLLVSAAISLEDALNEIKAEFEKEHPGVSVAYDFGASGTLQLQIEQGAGVDVFASAAEDQMNSLEKEGLLLPGTRRDFAANTAVLVVPKTASAPVSSFSDLTKPEVKWIAIGNPDTVPAGSYAKQILQHAGLWDSIKSKLVLAENVRQTLTYVEQGNADAGIVYRTDAATSDGVKIAAVAPEGSSQPIVYPAAVIGASKHQEMAKAFVDMISGPEGQAILAKYGFLPPGKAP